MRYILSGILLAIFAMPAFAAEEQIQQKYKELDVDKNGYLSLQETQDKHRIFYYYGKADKNNDGQIDQTEFSAFEAEVPDWESK